MKQQVTTNNVVERVVAQIGDLNHQLKEIIEIHKTQQIHLEAVTAWIQKHEEAQDAKKKAPTSAKK